MDSTHSGNCDSKSHTFTGYVFGTVVACVTVPLVLTREIIRAIPKSVSAGANSFNTGLCAGDITQEVVATTARFVSNGITTTGTNLAAYIKPQHFESSCLETDDGWLFIKQESETDSEFDVEHDVYMPGHIKARCSRARSL